MSEKITLDGVEYTIADLSDEAKKRVALLQFMGSQIQERTNTLAVLQRAKDSYIRSLKKEILANKAGYMFDEN